MSPLPWWAPWLDRVERVYWTFRKWVGLPYLDGMSVAGPGVKTYHCVEHGRTLRAWRCARCGAA